MLKLSERELEEFALRARCSFCIKAHEHTDFDVDLYLERSGADIVIGKNLKRDIGIDSFWTKGFKELHIDKECYMSKRSLRWRFTIAHELGHFTLHKDKQNDLNVTEWIEYQLRSHPSRNIEEQEANSFAGYFLISTDCLSVELENLYLLQEVQVLLNNGYMKKLVSEMFSHKLAGVFHVSVQVMEIRLDKYWK